MADNMEKKDAKSVGWLNVNDKMIRPIETKEGEPVLNKQGKKLYEITVKLDEIQRENGQNVPAGYYHIVTPDSYTDKKGKDHAILTHGEKEGSGNNRLQMIGDVYLKPMDVKNPDGTYTKQEGFSVPAKDVQTAYDAVYKQKKVTKQVSEKAAEGPAEPAVDGPEM